jgi:hypothetical protein
MINEKLYRRLERLEEEKIPADPPRIIDVCYVDSDGSPAGGYQVVIPACGSGHDYRRGAAGPRASSRNRFR